MTKPINGAMRRKIARYQRKLKFPRIEIDEYLDWVDDIDTDTLQEHPWLGRLKAARSNEE